MGPLDPCVHAAHAFRTYWVGQTHKFRLLPFLATQFGGLRAVAMGIALIALPAGGFEQFLQALQPKLNLV